MLSRKHIDSFSHANDTPLFDNERVWEFRYKIQYEEPRVKVVEQDPLTICWKNIKRIDSRLRGYEEDQKSTIAKCLLSHTFLWSRNAIKQ